MAEFSVKGEWDLKPNPPQPDTPCECCGRLKDALRGRCFQCQANHNKHRPCLQHCSRPKCQNPREPGQTQCWIHWRRQQEKKGWA
jgi:hypothetical protein